MLEFWSGIILFLKVGIATYQQTAVGRTDSQLWFRERIFPRAGGRGAGRSGHRLLS